MNLSGVLSQLVSLFLLIGTGYISARVGLISPDFRQKLSNLVINIACPCIILSSVLTSDAAPSDMLYAVLVAALFYAVMIALAALLIRLVRTPASERRLDQSLLVFTNVGFMGIPLVESLYGASGVAMLAMFILMFNLIFFSYGVLLIASDAKLNLRALINPGIISSLIALFFGLTGLHLPTPVESAISSIGAVNTPLAMMIIGASLAHSDVRAAFTRPRLYRVSLLRLVLMPAASLLLVHVLPLSPMLAGICVLMASMPIAGNCAMLANVYTPEDMTASHAVIVTTMLCAVTLPLTLAAMTFVL